MRSIGGYLRLETDYFTYYFILKFIITIIMTVVLIKHHKDFFSNRFMGPIAKWSLLFLAGICGMGLFRVVFEFSSQCSLNYGGSEAGIFNVLDAFCNIIFLMSLISFIKDFKDFEFIMYLFILASIVTIIDFIFLYKMEIITSVIHIVKPDAAAQRYNGIIQNDYVSMGKFLTFSIGASMYFWITEHKIKWLFLAFILFYIIAHTAQRLNMLMALVVLFLCFITWLKTRVSKYQIVPVVSLLIALFVAAFYFFPPYEIYIEKRGSMLTNPEELYSRFFLWAHAFNFSAIDFILGIGPGESQYCLAEILKTSSINFPFLYNLTLESSKVPRGFHNAYLTFVIENGLIGLLIIFWLLLILFKLNRTVKKGLRRISGVNSKMHVAYNVSFSIIIALSFGYMFDHNYEWILFLLSIFMIFLAYGFIMRAGVISSRQKCPNVPAC
jgi:O-antigen ligase